MLLTLFSPFLWVLCETSVPPAGPIWSWAAGGGLGRPAKLVGGTPGVCGKPWHSDMCLALKHWWFHCCCHTSAGPGQAQITTWRWCQQWRAFNTGVRAWKYGQGQHLYTQRWKELGDKKSDKTCTHWNYSSIHGQWQDLKTVIKAQYMDSYRTWTNKDYAWYMDGNKTWTHGD